jgi:HSP20 family protein
MLVRTFGYSPVGQLATEMDRLFDAVLSPVFASPSAAARAGFPAFNAWEDSQNVYLEAEIPGVPMDQLEITVQGDELTVKGQRPAPKNESFVRQERWHGSFERTLTLPAPIEADKVNATLTNGVLTVTLPKAESARARKIQVRGK